MTRIIVRDLVWDSYNTEHIKKHNVQKEEIILCVRRLVYHRRTHSGRYLCVGRSGKRIITVILRWQKLSTYYLITARDANKKERRDLYEKEGKK